MSLPAPWQVPDAGAGDSSRKKQKTDDPEAVVILHGVGAAKFVEPVKTKEILTPRARDLRSLENGFPSSEKDMFAMEGRECNASTSSEEDTDSEGYMQRHAPLEAEERTRYTSDGGRNKPRCSGAVGIEDGAKGKKTLSSGREHRNRMPKMQSLNSFDEKSTGLMRIIQVPGPQQPWKVPCPGSTPFLIFLRATMSRTPASPSSFVGTFVDVSPSIDEEWEPVSPAIAGYPYPLILRCRSTRVYERVNRHSDVLRGAMAAARRLASPRFRHLGGTFPWSTSAFRHVRSDATRNGGEDRATELIFKLERRGEGWAEEILPSLTIERRDVPQTKATARKEAQRRAEGAAERFVCHHGVPEEQAASVVDRACAWRVTRGGRALIDRRRRKRVQRHMEKVVRYLEDVCGVESGEGGVAKVLQATPQILGCNVALNDRWERRVVELAAYMVDHEGSSDVPQGWEPNPELGNWVGKQRAAKQQGTLSEEREEMLNSMGFTFDKFHETSVCWEERFDFLLDFKLSHGHCLVPKDWVLEDGCELGAWVEEQRRLYRDGLLTEGMTSRLEHIGFVWDVPASDTWIEQYSELIKYTCDPERQRLGIQPRFVNRSLSKWVEEQLQLWRKGSLKPELQSLLEDAGLSLDSSC